MDKPIVFFHVALMGKFQAIVNEMVGAMIASGLWEAAQSINICTAHIEQVDSFDLWFSRLGLSTPVCIHPLEVPEEAHTLMALRDSTLAHPNAPHLYVHTKGVANGSDNPNIDEWRRYMSHFCITRWRDCVKSLEGLYDTVGVDYRTEPAPHYSGNFWWARGNHINFLGPISEVKGAPSERHKAEFWVTSRGDASTHRSLHDCGVSVYERHLCGYPREGYVSP